MKINNHIPFPKGLLLTFLAAVLAIAGVSVSLIKFQPYNSDTLYMLDFFSSLKAGNLGSFQYSHLPDFIPGAIIIVPLLAAGVPWKFAYAIYSSMMFFAFALSILYIYYAISPKKFATCFYLFIMFSTVIVLVASADHLQILVVGVHGGSFVISVLCAVASWLFLSRASPTGWLLLAAVAVVTCLATLSDVLFFFEFVAPVVATSLGMVLLRSLPLSKTIIFNLAILSASLAGKVALSYLPVSSFPPSSLQELLDNSSRFIHSLQPSFIIIYFLPFLVLSLWFCAALFFADESYSNSRRNSGGPLHSAAWVYFWTFGLVASIAALGVTVCAYVDGGSFRYALAFFWWPPILGITLLASLASRLPYLAPIAAAVSLVILLVAGLPSRPMFWARALANCLEEKSQTIPLHAGLAEYWIARPLTVFSEGKFTVSQVLKDGQPYVHINSIIDYSVLNYNFVILDELDVDKVFSNFGQPERILECDAFRIAQYKDSSGIRSKMEQWSEGLTIN